MEKEEKLDKELNGEPVCSVTVAVGLPPRTFPSFGACSMPMQKLSTNMLKTHAEKITGRSWLRPNTTQSCACCTATESMLHQSLAQPAGAQRLGWRGDKGFDPLGVTDALPVYWVREAELKRSLVRIRRKLKASLLTASSISARRQLLSLH